MNTEKQYVGEKLICRAEIKKSGMADHICKEKGDDLPFRNQAKIIDWEKHSKIRRLKETAHLLSSSDLLGWLNIEIDKIWEPLIKMSRSKNCNINYGEKKTLWRH